MSNTGAELDYILANTMVPIVLPLLLCVIVSSSVKAESHNLDPSQCPAGTYWENVVGRCEMCSQLCPYKHVQKLPGECEDTCNPPTPDPTQCPAGTYWDNVVGRCEMCSQLCPYKYVQKLPGECEDTCNPPTPATESNESLSGGAIVTIVLMVALVITALVAIPVLLNKKCKKPLKFPQQETHDPEACEDMPMRPVQENLNV